MSREKPVDWSKPLVTVNGLPARLLGVINSPHDDKWVVARAAPYDSTREVVTTYHKDGSLYRTKESQDDLVNMPEKITQWVNVYDKGMRGFATSLTTYPTEREAKEGRSPSGSYIATVKIEFEV